MRYAYVYVPSDRIAAYARERGRRRYTSIMRMQGRAGRLRERTYVYVDPYAWAYEQLIDGTFRRTCARQRVYIRLHFVLHDIDHAEPPYALRPAAATHTTLADRAM